MDIKSWINHIIEIYDKSETLDVYKRRSNNESKSIKSVLKAIQEQKFRLLSTQNKADFIHLLKAADSISLDVGTDYLEQFLQLPDVQKIITERLTSYNLEKVEAKAEENELWGTLPDFPKTVAEKDKAVANKYLSSDSMLKGRTPEQEISRFYERISKIADTGIFSIKTEAITLQDITTRQNMMVRLGRVICRQQGMNPGSMNLEDGRITFEMDVPDKEPIFHGMKQEQGLTMAQQERLKAEQQHQQEQEKIIDDKNNQTEVNNQYSMDAKNKRENAQRTNKESSKELSAKETFMQQAKKSQFKQTKSKSFLNSLKVNTENINRTNLLQSQNQSNARKRSKGMGMSL